MPRVSPLTFVQTESSLVPCWSPSGPLLDAVAAVGHLSCHTKHWELGDIANPKAAMQTSATFSPLKTKLQNVSWPSWPHAHCPVLGTVLVQAQGNGCSAPSGFILISTGQAFPLMTSGCGAGRVCSWGCKAAAGAAYLPAFLFWHLGAHTRLAADPAEGWDVPALQPHSWSLRAPLIMWSLS